MNGSRYFASWGLVATMLIAPLASAAGRFECRLGMRAAGPACPLCHGRSSAPVKGTSIQGRCCTQVAAKVAQAEAALVGHTRVPAMAYAMSFASSDGSGSALDLAPSRHTSHARAAPAPSPLYLSNFLRL